MKTLYLWEVRLAVEPWNDVTRKIATEEKKKVAAVMAVLQEAF